MNTDAENSRKTIELTRSQNKLLASVALLVLSVGAFFNATLAYFFSVTLIGIVLYVGARMSPFIMSVLRRLAWLLPEEETADFSDDHAF